MPDLLDTLHDFLIIFAIAAGSASAVTIAAFGLGLWWKSGQVRFEERLRSERAERVDLANEIRVYRTSRDRETADERQVI